MCSFYGVQRGELIKGTEVKVRVGKFKNGKAGDNDEVTGERLKGGGDMVGNWI